MKIPDAETPPDAVRLGNDYERLVDEVEQVRARVEERNTRRIRKNAITLPDRETVETVRAIPAARPAPPPPTMPPPDRPSAPATRLREDSGRYLYVSPTPPRARRP